MSRRHLKFEADLEGVNEVPPVETEAEGSASLRFNREITVLNVEVFVEEIKDVVQAHIHLGRPDENGPVVVVLFGPSDPVDVEREGRLACRTVTRGDLIGPLAGEPLSALLEQIEDGNAYINVHTVQHPGGEIRGQIEKD